MSREKLLKIYQGYAAEIDNAFSEYVVEKPLGGFGVDAIPITDDIFFEFLEEWSVKHEIFN